MSKTSGLGGVIIVQDSAAEYNTITNDVTNYSFSTPRAVQDVTGVDKSAHERILLLADASITLNGVFNTADDESHDTFSTIPTTVAVRNVEIDPIGSTTGYPTLLINYLLTDYQITRAATGELTWQVPGSLADGTVPAWSTHA